AVEQRLVDAAAQLFVDGYGVAGQRCGDGQAAGLMGEQAAERAGLVADDPAGAEDPVTFAVERVVDVDVGPEGAHGAGRDAVGGGQPRVDEPGGLGVEDVRGGQADGVVQDPADIPGPIRQRQVVAGAGEEQQP